MKNLFAFIQTLMNLLTRAYKVIDNLRRENRRLRADLDSEKRLSERYTDLYWKERDKLDSQRFWSNQLELFCRNTIRILTTQNEEEEAWTNKMAEKYIDGWCDDEYYEDEAYDAYYEWVTTNAFESTTDTIGVNYKHYKDTLLEPWAKEKLDNYDNMYRFWVEKQLGFDGIDPLKVHDGPFEFRIYDCPDGFVADIERYEEWGCTGSARQTIREAMESAFTIAMDNTEEAAYALRCAGNVGILKE